MRTPRGDIPLVVPLTRVRQPDAAIVGAKAVGLARMLRADLPVPAGFCVTARAYREHLRGDGRADRIEQALARLTGESTEQTSAVLAEVREILRETAPAEDVRETITHHWRALGGASTAVRSSATAEDLPAQSFAGQYETFLAVADVPTCLRRVRDCWASLWSPRAFEYCRRADIDLLNVDMAVIVQVLVPAEAAGVMFTADPVTGRRDWVVIEGSFGLGEAVVGGKVTPDRIVVSRRIPLVVARTTVAKPLEIVPAESGGVRERAVDPARAARACLDDVASGRLARLGVEVEALLGGPQDVEWALARGQIHLLQARPITALPPAPRRDWQDRQIWTNANVREAAPDVMTPMTHSLVLSFLQPAFGPMLRKAGIEIALRDLADLVGGRVYFNINTLLAIRRAVPNMRMGDLGALFGGGGQGLEGPMDFRVPDEDLPDLRVPWYRRIIRLPDLLLWFLRHPGRLAPRILAEAKAHIAAMERQPWRELPDEQLVGRIRAAVDGMSEFVASMPVLLVGLTYCLVLTELSGRWLGEDGRAIANRLLAGLGGLEDAEAGIQLWRLAAMAHSHDGLEAAIRDEEHFEALRRRIAGTDEGDAFLGAWARFMDDNGHHARGEIELGNPRWAEMPDYVLGLVRSYLSGLGRLDPAARARGLARQRRDLATQCSRRLRNPVKRLVFRALLRRAQSGLRFRETSKSVAVRWIALLRWTMLELGDRLARRGVIAQRDDIFFLRPEELHAAAVGNDGPDARERIASRRVEYERNAAVTPPTVVFGRFDPEAHAPPAVNEQTDLFRGFAVSSGLVRGKARVILHVGGGHVLPGEVLVAPFTDPGWTPYFLNASAVVMDQGGVLSHGSIIAREYGIPCVVNVGPATEVIRTGQRLEVDGDRGVVRILA